MAHERGKSEGWPAVRKAELKDIHIRRREAGILAPKSDSEDGIQHAADLVGLAFSGGGIRSASFNLGVLQALQQKGVLRHIDLMSTVSGGGYIGSHLSSLVLKERVSGSSSSLHTDDFPLHEAPGGKQPNRVVEFIRNGHHMVSHPFKFLSAYLSGTLFNNLIIVTGLLTVCSFVALSFRSLDMPVVHDAIKDVASFVTDSTRPFIPAFVLFCFWLLLKLLPWDLSKLHTWLFSGIVASTLVAVMLLLGNGDISGLQVDRSQFQWVIWSLLGVLVLLLIPTIQPWRLLRSGTGPRNTIDELLFKSASMAVLVGIPLAVVWFLGRENVSGYGTERTPFVALDIDDWSFFLAVGPDNDAEKKPALPVGALVLDLSGGPKSPEIQFLKARFRESIRKVRDRDKSPYLKYVEAAPKHGRLPARWEDVYAHMVSKLSDPRWDKKSLYKRQYVVQEALLADLNGHLFSQKARSRVARDVVDPWFWPAVEKKERRIGERRNTPDYERVLPDTLLSFAGLTRRQKRWLDANAHAAVNANLRGEPFELGDDFVRLYLEARYPLKIYNRRRILRRIVIERDQRWRVTLFLISAGAFAVLATFHNPNSTSVHRYYRRQLSEAYLEPLPKYGRAIPLHELRTVEAGAPYHLINCALQLVWRRKSVDPVASFVFSNQYCGSRVTGFSKTTDQQNCRIDLPTAMAISGAAVTPSQSRSPLVIAMMYVLNLRLGQWVPNPSREAVVLRPTLRRILLDFVLRRPEDRTFCFLSDGGHRENLGLGELLARRCQLMIVSDASHDPDHTCPELIKLYRMARTRYGVRFYDPTSKRPMSLDDLRLKVSQRYSAEAPELAHSSAASGAGFLGVSTQHYVVVEVKYAAENTVVQTGGKDVQLAEPRTGHLIYLKPSFTGDEEIDLKQYREEHPQFPHDPTSDVAFDEDQFESYRQLGHHIGCELFAGVEGLGRDAGPRCLNDWVLRNIVVRRIPQDSSTGDAVAATRVYVEGTLRETRMRANAIRDLLSGDPDVIRVIEGWVREQSSAYAGSRDLWCDELAELVRTSSERLSAEACASIKKMLADFGGKSDKVDTAIRALDARSAESRSRVAREDADLL